MDDTSWIVPGIFGLILAIGALTFAIHIFMEQLKARRNRAYKTLDEHRILNASRAEGPHRRSRID